MTPSPRWQAPRSSGWTPPPGSSCAIPTRPRTPSRRRSSGPGVTCPHCAAPIASTPGSTGCSYRACIDEARRLRRHRFDVELTPIDAPSIDDTTSSMADRDQLERGFSRLEPEARALIVLHHYLDLPLPEVAIALGIPLGTAKSRLHRALQIHASGARRRCPTSVGDHGGPSRMTLNDGFERTVSDWLDEQAGRGAPDYLDETLARTTRTRQRPAWSSLERWLPVDMTTNLRLAARPTLGRALLLGAVLALVIALGAAVRRHRLATPDAGTVTRARAERRDPLRRDRQGHPQPRPGDGNHGDTDQRSGGRPSAPAVAGRHQDALPPR